MKEKIESKDLVVKHNDLINSRYNLTLAEMRIILHMITMINKWDEDFTEYRIEIKNFVAETKSKHKGEYSRAKEITKNLMKKVLEIPTKEGHIQAAWIAGAKYYKGKGYVVLSFHPYLKPYLLNLQKKFTQYNIQYILPIKSFYSIRIYELLKQYKNMRSEYRVFKIEKLRLILGVKHEQYSKYNDFKRFIILQAQKELKKYTDICFDFEETKTSRKVTAIKFIIKTNKENLLSEKIEETKKVKQEQEIENKDFQHLVDLLLKENRDKKTILQIVEKWYALKGFDYVKRNIKYTNKNHKKNYTGFFIKSLENDWGMEMYEDELAEKKVRDERLWVEQEKAEQKKREEEKNKQERGFNLQIENYLKMLSVEERKEIEEQAISLFPIDIQEKIRNGHAIQKINLELKINEIVGEKLRMLSN